ncbi:cysteine hydrolase family protein [Isachenkonia alkalipeptolytica]|uniref:Cysteine hydrolase n=1 Tax=Isachenkonia alkalipeptolytica TaxID=2565777 RepID=A0AA44BE12_9CLOT|nr:isochorismatase family cysteine hydrolase [Isachenkonia alkalipeptolytica]NBG88453.1 cysteine hydrolase [Isachenkonia alkalipeptolytica]
MRLDKTALLLIDLQNESQYGIQRLNEVINNAETIIHYCRKNHIPIIYTRQINRSDGLGLPYNDPVDATGKPKFYCSETSAVEIIDAVAPKKGDLVIDKFRWSGFYETSLDLMLKSLDVKELIIGGLVTDGCLMTSVFDGFFKDYRIHLVKDLCSTTNEGAHMASILIMANWVYGIEIYNSKEMIKRLNGFEYNSWKSESPDSLHFTPENMREVFHKLDQ